MKIKGIVSKDSGEWFKEASNFDISKNPFSSIINLNYQKKYQTITGFGASFTDASAYLINKVLNEKEKNELMMKLFDYNEGIGISFLRNPMGSSDFARDFYSYDDMPKGEEDFNLEHFSIEHDLEDIIPLTLKAKEINPDITVMASPWSPPGWMKSTDSMIGGFLRYYCYDVYSRYFLKFINEYKKQGIDIKYITLQNEPDFSPPHYAGMRFTAVEAAYFINNFIGPLFKENHVETKILAYDHNWDLIEYPMTILDLARKYVDGVAWHVYGGNVSSQTKLHEAYPGIETHFTESSGGEWVHNAISAMINSGINVMRNWSKSMILWNIALDEINGPFVPGFGKSICHGLVTINQQTKEVLFNRADYFALGHFSKFVKKDALRVDTNNDIINNVAFINKDESLVIVLSNSSPEERKISVRIDDEYINLTLDPCSHYTYEIRRN